MKPRERLTSSLCLKWMTITACTLDAVQTVFVDLFCSPKCSMENPSLFVSGQDGSTNRTFIVEDYPEDEYGQWATDEATGEKVFFDDERSCFWAWDDNEHGWQSSQFKSREAKRRKGKGKGKGRTTFLKVNSVPLIQKRVQIMNNTTRTKEEAKIRKEKARKVLVLNQDFQNQKHTVKKDLVISGNLTIGIPV